MERKKSTVLTSLISVFLICLLASTATTTVAAGEWGSLAVGDTMQWDTDATVVTDEGTWTIEFTTQMEILEINDGTVKVKMSISFGGSTFTDTETDDDFRPFIFTQEQLEGVSIENYNFDGTNYEAANMEFEETQDGITYNMEIWVDTGTGVLFEADGESDAGDSLEIMLVSTTADLTESGGVCLGTVLIALVSVTTLVSYSLIRYQKKKRT